MHVDGFRFDLAAALGREEHAVERTAAFFDLIQQDPVVSPGQAHRRAVGRRRGRLPGRQLPAAVVGVERQVPRLRCATTGAARTATLAELGYRLTGSSDLYEYTARRPHASINFVTAHDGFTLADLVSYNDKHNEANGEDNRRRRRRQPLVELRRRGPDRRSGRHRAAAPPAAQLPGHAVRCRRACRCSSAATRSAARRAATTTPTARTTRSAGSTGSTPMPGCSAFAQGLIAMRQSPPRVPAPALVPGPARSTARASPTSPGSCPTAR